MKILLAEDEPILLEFLHELILRLNLPFACELFCAENGKIAYERLCATPIDLAIVDIKMPEMTGIDVLKAAHENDLIKTKFIIYSGFQEFSYAQMALQLGAFDYLVKPVNEDVLYETLVHAHNVIFEESLSVSRSTNNYSALVNKLTQMLEKHLRNPELSLKWLCQNELYVNETHAGRVFHREVGIKFSDYVKTERLKQAVLLMDENPHMLVSDIARALGYENNPDYFIELFKKKYQMTPKQYQKFSKQQ